MCTSHKLSFTALVAILATVSYAADPFAAMSYYDALIFGNVSASTGDIEGRAAIGGDLNTPGGYSVGDRAPDDPTKYSLVVGGNLHAPGHWQVFNGNARYGTGTQLPSMEPGYTISQGPGDLNFGAAYTTFRSISTYLGGLSDNGTQLYQFTTYTLTGTNAGLNVFNVNAADWAAASNRVIDAPTGSTVIVNIAGASAGMMNGMQALNNLHDGSTRQTRILFNFHQATTVNITNMAVTGSVLAPDALVTISGGGIDGQAVLGALNQINGGEIHRWDFTGSTPVPEPGTMAALGLGALALLKRRRK
jgi:choice-of-anchor A domain-containing protein